VAKNDSARAIMLEKRIYIFLYYEIKLSIQNGSSTLRAAYV